MSHSIDDSSPIFQTENGKVLRCACCDCIQITFREHTLLVNEDELEVLTETIKHAWRNVQDNDGLNQWELQAGTDAGPVAITLSESSLRTLHALLQGAWSMYTLQNGWAPLRRRWRARRTTWYGTTSHPPAHGGAASTARLDSAPRPDKLR